MAWTNPMAVRSFAINIENFSSEKPQYSEGETVTVYYLPSSPNEVRPKILTDFTVVAISFCILGLIPMVFANYEFCNERKEAALLKQDPETAFFSLSHHEEEQNQMETATNIPPQYFYLKLLSESGFHYLLLIASFLATLLSYFILFFILIKLGIEDVWVCGGLSFFFTIGFNFYCIDKIVNVFSPVFIARADAHGLVFKTFNQRSKDESYSWNNLHQFGFKSFKGGSFTAIDWLNEYDHTFKYCGIHHVKLYNWLRTYFPEKEKIHY